MLCSPSGNSTSTKKIYYALLDFLFPFCNNGGALFFLGAKSVPKQLPGLLSVAMIGGALYHTLTILQAAAALPHPASHHVHRDAVGGGEPAATAVRGSSGSRGRGLPRASGRVPGGARPRAVPHPAAAPPSAPRRPLRRVRRAPRPGLRRRGLGRRVQPLRRAAVRRPAEPARAPVHGGQGRAVLRRAGARRRRGAAGVHAAQRWRRRAAGGVGRRAARAARPPRARRGRGARSGARRRVGQRQGRRARRAGRRGERLRVRAELPGASQARPGWRWQWRRPRRVRWRQLHRRSAQRVLDATRRHDNACSDGV